MKNKAPFICLLFCILCSPLFGDVVFKTLNGGQPFFKDTYSESIFLENRNRELFFIYSDNGALSISKSENLGRSFDPYFEASISADLTPVSSFTVFEPMIGNPYVFFTARLYNRVGLFMLYFDEEGELKLYEGQSLDTRDQLDSDIGSFWIERTWGDGFSIFYTKAGALFEVSFLPFSDNISFQKIFEFEGTSRSFSYTAVKSKTVESRKGGLFSEDDTGLIHCNLFSISSNGAVSIQHYTITQGWQDFEYHEFYNEEANTYYITVLEKGKIVTFMYDQSWSSYEQPYYGSIERVSPLYYEQNSIYFIEINNGGGFYEYHVYNPLSNIDLSQHHIKNIIDVQPEAIFLLADERIDLLQNGNDGSIFNFNHFYYNPLENAVKDVYSYSESLKEDGYELQIYELAPYSFLRLETSLSSNELTITPLQYSPSANIIQEGTLQTVSIDQFIIQDDISIGDTRLLKGDGSFLLYENDGVSFFDKKLDGYYRINPEKIIIRIASEIYLLEEGGIHE